MKHKAKSYQEEQAEVLAELDRRACVLAVEEFISIGNAVGIDVVAEILDCNKSAAQVFEIIREQQGGRP